MVGAVGSGYGDRGGPTGTCAQSFTQFFTDRRSVRRVVR